MWCAASWKSLFNAMPAEAADFVALGYDWGVWIGGQRIRYRTRDEAEFELLARPRCPAREKKTVQETVQGKTIKTVHKKRAPQVVLQQPFRCGRYWIRTSDLRGVSTAL